MELSAFIAFAPPATAVVAEAEAVAVAAVAAVVAVLAKRTSGEQSKFGLPTGAHAPTELRRRHLPSWLSFVHGSLICSLCG